jgi:signal transduction histidine kinase
MNNDERDERANILIVDDLPEKLLVFGTVLEELGQNLVFVRSGSEALREVLQREFAVILLDVNMPDIDGFETASLIRKYKRSAHTPIIFITAYADEMQTAQGYSLGAVDYILSPVMPEMLRSKVKVFVDLHTMQGRIRRQADERVARVAAEAAQRVAEENGLRAAFLSRASNVLAASLDPAVAMRGLVELLVPDASALALLVMTDERQVLDGGLLARAPGEQVLQVTPMPAARLSAGLQQVMQRALRQHSRQLLSAHELAELQAMDAALQVAAAVPLVAGGRVLGVLLVGLAQPDAGLAAAGWALLDELAGRAAIALENATLYRSLQAEIVERRAAQDELQYANQRKDEFLAMLSHELRNPLAPIRNALEIMRRVAPPEPKLKWAGDVMDRQVTHLTRLVEELLDVARISEGKISLNRQPVDLGAVVAQSVETAQPFVDARSHTLSVSLPGTPVWLQGDAARLSQIVSNLLHNAAKYSENGGRIDLSLRLRSGEAVVSVRDNGMGIDAALLPRIFDLFAQGSRALDRSQGGLGVGLTLARRLAELHGGRIEARSEGVGRGSEFIFTVPCVSLVAAERPAVPAPAVAPAGGGPRPRRVLIVDDNQDAAESVAEFLQIEGHEVQAVFDAEVALARAPVFAPQVVLLDIGLPQISGYEVCRRLRAMPQTRHALIVALTGYGQKEDQRLALEAGFNVHLVKPTDPDALVALIADWKPEGTTATANA